ncbi:glycosyltransferase [Antrihabitans stalactiti]|uniref:Glycosyltransferase family 4 protein n=1 Tax=Antrihabitans stalactiti TaxID=2584121 RepID=A0A848KED2_9NOCA|nr:glycosyltransferase [Antrihabitans stalactiti]NMN96659.1 glycosyltransferase family 4 protein [Antrihabitans stalactiti]
MRPSNNITRVVADSWYSERLAGLYSLDSWLKERPQFVQRAVDRYPSLRGVALAFAGRNSMAIVTTNGHVGTKLCILVCGLLGWRKLILLEYIPNPPRPGMKLLVLRRINFIVLRRWLLRRCLIVSQMMTESEFTAAPTDHGIPAERFRLVQYPLRFDNAPFENRHSLDERESLRVLASGRRVDWQTVFAAAEGTDWDLRVVCLSTDLPEVRRLAASRPATIRFDLDAGSHQDEVINACVFIIAVPETGGSIGQMRVMNAFDAGTAIVVSDVAGLRGYVDDTTAVLVPPGDPIALRAAVDDLLHNPEKRAKLTSAARKSTYSMTEYEERISRLISQAVGVDDIRHDCLN